MIVYKQMNSKKLTKKMYNKQRKNDITLYHQNNKKKMNRKDN